MDFAALDNPVVTVVHPPSFTMSMRQVPNELLLEIFRSLPRHTITALSLTCRKFKDISRPFLFTHLHFHPYSVRDDAILLPPSIVVDGALECLEFWTSDEIAPHVRSCKITPSEDTMVWHQNDESKWEILEFSIANPDSHYTLLDLFFERLGAFTRLRSFHAELVHFTQAGLATLCRASTLIDVQLVGCGVVAGERIDTTSLQLAVTRFSFAHKDVASAREGLRSLAPVTPSRPPPRGGTEVQLSCLGRKPCPLPRISPLCVD
ncbi:L-aminoadipate-semialdehyde dehydrogenase [Mycena sanguinolenta]|uniref:L-aminoadipate-semialdehyde dehydrogenase n=1 Tax=Mycena sanguinolenta TaxID=230812 RepID=A0A8H6ZCG5_9AGAR|nr:L-aminoadipate-semialdehyde dehydrogenase [Mycena sanguinolenta]